PNSLLERLDALRTVKTDYEVICLAEANMRAAKGHQALQKLFYESDHAELDLHLSYLRATAQDDAETPYKNIVALGPNAATLHHISYRKTPGSRAESQSLLVDAGATFQGYCSDITRTWVKGGSAAADAFAELVDGVETLQKRLCHEAQVGLP